MDTQIACAWLQHDSDSDFVYLAAIYTALAQPLMQDRAEVVCKTTVYDTCMTVMAAGDAEQVHHTALDLLHVAGGIYKMMLRCNEYSLQTVH